jgi:hypothetical protein
MSPAAARLAPLVLACAPERARARIPAVDDTLTRIWEQLVGRATGPMAFRFVLQPAMAVTIAVYAGLRDARAHRPPFLWTFVTERRARRALLRSGWRDVGRVFVLAIALDAVYQVGVLRTFHPLQAVAVAGLLAFVPYAATRGLATRLAARNRLRS